ncbi:TadE/TadG family type IV pilus assembly protein [Planctomyces sp. SH-PL62]|uniref:TadE/TadG family type IV pilus assembly protein n=1 Tax=Planctomyces sp. SH-PL62 TaxID=1636152 RepID=UPI00078C5604|nr:TadE/TadG family type IV pilus assembly protein [Planctomyces sp. SH-PL62]AMV38173.1 TadE-like protein [Planctomyces sp. SH-PL62]
MRRVRSGKSSRRGAAALELALLLPPLCFLCVITIDFARAFADVMTLAECARVGAIRGATRTDKPVSYGEVQADALARAVDLETPPTIELRQGTDLAGGAYVEVAARYTLHPLFPYPGVPDSISITRTVRMRRPPGDPNPGA